MRPILLTILACACATSAARAEPSCTALIERVQAAAGAELAERSTDSARFTAGSETSLTLSCGGVHPSSVGAQHRSEAPPDTYFELFGQAGQAVTGIGAELLRDAARRARDGAGRLRHSNVDAGGVRVTCSLTRNEKGPLTLCAAIERSERS